MLSPLETIRRHLVISSVLLLLTSVLAITGLTDARTVGERVPVAVAAGSHSSAVVPAVPGGSIGSPANAADDTHVVVIVGVVQDCLTGRGVLGEVVHIREVPSVNTVTDRDGNYTLVAQLALPAEYTIEITTPRYFSPRAKGTGVIQPASQGETQVIVNFTGADCQPPKPTPSAPPVDARITLEPLTAINEVNQPHTITATVEVKDQWGWTIAPDGTPVTFSLRNNAAGAAFAGSSVCTTVNGFCSVVINAGSAGRVDIHAATDITAGSTVLHRETDGTGGNSGDAHKVYVDARIRVEPLQATNEVNQPHPVTATVEVNDGSGWRNAPDGTPVAFSLLNNTAQAAFVDGDSCVTSFGSCAITINTDTAGRVDIRASTDVVVAGLALTRTTGTGGLNSGDAHKVYVDGSIRIEPDGVNEVGTPHTFTVTVEADYGQGGGMQPAVVLNPTVAFSTTPSNVIDNCAATGTDANGQCTVTINSDTAGTFTANADVVLVLGGVPITRDTTGNSGPGGSGPATKTYVDANIRIEPSAANEVGTAHTFTVTVEQNDGTGWVPAGGENPTVSLSPAPGSVTDNCATAGTDADGQCTVTVNSDTAGTFTADAKTTLSVAGVSLTRDTADNSGPGGSGPATKRYVDASIRVEPSAANEVGTAHTFIVTVQTDDGSGSGLQPVDGVNPEVTFDTAPPDVTDNCASAGTDAGGQCTVVINSDAPGIFTANAKITLPVGGVSVTRDTAGTSGPGGSGPATKTYVDARIRIEPSATNEVGQAHTFTVTVEQNDGTGWVPAGDENPTVSLSPAPDSVSDNCASTGTDGDGQCTVVINSDVTGTFTANARITLTLSGLSVTRDTAGNSGPGGSGPATKTYVDANIRIEPSATNEVGTAHTFTVTVMTDDGTGSGLQPAAGVSPEVTFDTAPPELTDNCAATGTDANGQCSVVINSDTAGTFTANAKITLPVGGLTVTRDTGGNSGPGGSGPATKTYVDANIRIEPSDINVVGDPHTFVVTVKADDGSGTGLQPVEGVNPEVTFDVTPPEVTDNCATIGTDAAGQCTVVINSDKAGTFTANAKITLSVAGVSVTRDTAGNSGPGGSGPATKTYLNASIRIEPSATNEVGTSHTFTVTVVADVDGGPQPVAGVTPSINVSPTPSSLTDNCATAGTDANGQCTVVINSDTAGIFTANASASTTVSGLSIRRDTAGESGPGGSGPATKTYVDARIRIEPSATNEVGTAHTFTVTVEKNDGTGWTPADGENPTVTLSSVPSSLTDNCATTGTDAAGQCTVTINSDVTGTFAANAKITLPVGGVSVTRDTAGNSGPGGSGPATKIYVDANIRIEPSATNEVGTAHTFTVTVQADDGSGSGMQPVEGVNPEVTFDTAPPALTDNCASIGTDANGQCTVVINSDTAGSFTANAKATIALDGASLTRDTAGNSGPGGSGPATKRYVDASIRVEPSATNEVGTAHTFIVTVQTDDGSGSGLQPVDGVNPEVTFDTAPPDVTDNCASAGTDAGGQCTVVINSDAPGIFTANAKITLSVGGVSVTRDTGGNSGPGGSGLATKTYVDASIRIEPSATNEVGTAHTFTVTVEQNDGTGWVPAAGEHPPVTLSPAPGSVTDNCATTGTDADGQCTVVINSDVTGTFTANAQITLTLSGLSVTRDTAGNSGPGGSGPATKRYVDANIRIEPSAVNTVGEPHTFIVTVQADDGSGGGLQLVEGVNPEVTFDVTPPAVTDNCASAGTDAAGQCTVVINSTTAGTFTANAKITLSVGGLNVTRDTAGNSGPGGSGPATKRYVQPNANIRIEPSATNDVGTPHTFTVTVKLDDGRGGGLQPVAGVNPVVTVSPTPGSLTDNCASAGTNADGQCTVVINSDKPGTFTANAKITLMVDWLSMTRDTAGDGGPGGSGPATKTYVDANISITPDPTNDVGDPHTFTVAVEKNVGEGWVPAQGENPTVVWDPMPEIVEDNCATTGTDAAGKCTVVINSDKAGTFTANARVTLSIDGASITRDTAGNSGPGGSGPTAKVYVDATVAVEPSVTTATGDTQTFTVTVLQDDGRGSGPQPAQGVKPIVTLSPTPSDVTDNCATLGTDANGQCTVVVHSGDGKTFEVYAAVSMPVSELYVIRDSAGNKRLPVEGHARLRPGVSSLNMRSGAGIENPVVGYVLPDNVLIVQDSPQLVAGDPWYPVFNETRDEEGWVNGRYLVPQPAP